MKADGAVTKGILGTNDKINTDCKLHESTVFALMLNLIILCFYRQDSAMDLQNISSDIQE